jgi:predicted RNA-binding Zn-ribbon protein involved in translation (DUF1610 family)
MMSDDAVVGFLFFMFLVGGLLGIIPAAIAGRKGHSYFGWWLFGAALFIVALPVAILISPSKGSQKKCPDCANWVATEATKCQHCGADFRVGAVGSKPGVDYVNPRYVYPSQEGIDSTWNAIRAAATQPATKECPQCAETVRFRAKVCRFCGYDFTASQPGPVALPT